MLLKNVDMEQIIDNDFYYDENKLIEIIREIQSLNRIDLANDRRADVKLLAIGITQALRDGKRGNLYLMFDNYINNTGWFFKDKKDSFNESLILQYNRILTAAKHIDTQKANLKGESKDVIGSARIFIEKNYFSDAASKQNIYGRLISNSFLKFKNLMDNIRKDKVLKSVYGDLTNPGTVLYSIIDNSDMKGLERFQNMVTYLLDDQLGTGMVELGYMGDYGVDVIPAVYNIPLPRGQTLRALENPDYFSNKKSIKLSKQIKELLNSSNH